MSSVHLLEQERRRRRPCEPEDLAGFAGVALREHSLDRLFAHALELVGRALEVERVEMLELTPAGELVARARTGGGSLENVAAPVATDDTTHAGFTLSAREPVIFSELRADPRFSDPRLRERGVVSGIGVVVPDGGDRPYGVLGAYSSDGRSFTPEEAGCLAMLADILAGGIRRIAAEEQKLSAEARYRTLIEHLPLVTYVDALDASSSSIYASPQIGLLTGHSAQEWADDPELFVKLLHPDDRERVLAEHARLACADDQLSTEYRLVARDGRVVWVRDEAAVVRDGHSRTPYLQGVLIDITEQKRLGDQLVQSQKMEAIGRLAGGIAHDFNNLLTGIIGYAEFVLENLEPEDPLRTDVEEIASAGQRAARLTRQLLAFSRKQVLEPRVVALNDVVAELERMLGRVIGEDVELVTRLDPSLGRVRADRGQLEQVLMNLALNARDAMPDGGRLLIETANVELGDEYAHRHLIQAEPGSYVMLAVSDTGEGMDRETLERVFEPFFTTKGPGEGTGLGLSTVYGIVKQSGGSVWAYSELGHGSVFRVYLPRVDALPPGIAAAPFAHSGAQGGTETILLVEDEELVRNLIARDLRGLGYEVLVAADAGQAIGVAQRGHSIDLVLTDVAMPDLDGVALAEELRELQPAANVLFMTGYATAAVASGVAPGAVIEKPFRAGALAQRVRTLLDEPTAARAD